jgi:hypothetical protein
MRAGRSCLQRRPRRRQNTGDKVLARRTVVPIEFLPGARPHDGGPSRPPSSVGAMSDQEPTAEIPTHCPDCGTEMETATIDFDTTNEPRAELVPGEMARVAFCPNPDCPGKVES